MRLNSTHLRVARDSTGCVVSTSERSAGISWLQPAPPAAVEEAEAARARSGVVAAPDERSAAAGPAAAAVEAEAPASPLAVLGAVAEVAAGPAEAAAEAAPASPPAVLGAVAGVAAEPAEAAEEARASPPAEPDAAARLAEFAVSARPPAEQASPALRWIWTALPVKPGSASASCPEGPAWWK
jgi:hypothetical protein